MLSWLCCSEEKTSKHEWLQPANDAVEYFSDLKICYTQGWENVLADALPRHMRVLVALEQLRVAQP